jgi:hypothetical protein
MYAVVMTREPVSPQGRVYARSIYLTKDDLRLADAIMEPGENLSKLIRRLLDSQRIDLS